MFSEKKSIGRPKDFESMGLKMSSLDSHKVHMTGESIDRIYKKGVLIDEIVSHNIVVDSFLNLVMCLLKQEVGYGGLQYWAVGSGADSWDATPVDPEVTENRLTNEIGRVALTSSNFKFLDSDYNVTTTPSNILQVSRVFSETECNGTWREFGIFGGNATTDANSGILINKRHHGVITKTNEVEVERVMRFILNLV